jgi:hypothetical protein
VKLEDWIMRVKDAARIFNSSHLTQLATGDFSQLNRVATDLLSLDPLNISAKEVFELTYLELAKHYRHEYYYKNTIANKRLLGRHSLDTATMLSEFRVGGNIADCVILNGHSTCYEIKTEFDSLNRLQEQLGSYIRLFDKTYVVCDEKYINTTLEMAPQSVGVIQLTKRNTLSTIREAEDLSYKPISADLVMNSLRANEYKKLVHSISGNIPDVGNIEMHSACKNIILQANPDSLRAEYRNILKKSRKNNKELLHSLPKCLINAGVSYKLSIKLQQRLVSVLASNGERSPYVLSNSQGQTI